MKGERMHDQRKVTEEIDEKTREQRITQVREFASLYDNLLKKRQQNVFSEDVLRQLSVFLQKNPEAYSMYNYRRIVLMHILKEMDKSEKTNIVKNATSHVAAATTGITTTTTITSTTTEDKVVAKEEKLCKIGWLKEELELSSTILRNDYKVYAAFVHRRWIFEQIFQLAKDSIVSVVSGGHVVKNVTCTEELLFWSHTLMKEKKQCDALLAIDERNFHAWNYRRWVLSELTRMNEFFAEHLVDLDTGTLAAVTSKKDHQCHHDGGGDGSVVKPRLSLFTSEELKELNFTTKMISHNFSNYSAWHQRGVIINAALHRMHKESVCEQALLEAWAQLEEDLSLLTTAIYCDPVDQSAWYYAQFIDQAAEKLEHGFPAANTTRVDVRDSVVNTCIGILTEEKRVGDDDSGAYWPRYYLFTSLLSLRSCADDASRGKVLVTTPATVEMAHKICTALYSDDVDTCTDDTYVFCLQKLAAELVVVDPLRSGMYKSLLAAATDVISGAKGEKCVAEMK